MPETPKTVRFLATSPTNFEKNVRIDVPADEARSILDSPEKEVVLSIEGTRYKIQACYLLREQ